MFNAEQPLQCLHARILLYGFIKIVLLLKTFASIKNVSFLLKIPSLVCGVTCTRIFY